MVAVVARGSKGFLGPNVRSTTLFYLTIAAVVIAALAVRAVSRRRRKPPPPRIDPAALRVRALLALRDLADENGGDFVPAHKLVRRLGESPGLATVLEVLFAEGLTERGTAASGSWGDRPTPAGYDEAAKLEASEPGRHQSA